MSITSTLPRQRYTGNGVTTAFAVPFQFDLASDLKVIIYNTITFVSTVKTLSTHYTVTGGGGETGTVTMLTAPSATEILILVNDPSPTQDYSVAENGSFPTADIENAFDRVTLIAQRAYDLAGRSLHVSDSDGSAFSGELPSEDERANKFLAFDANGDPIASDGGISDAIPVSAYMETVLDDANAAAARTTLDALQETNSMTAETAPAVGDLAPIYDISVAANRKMTLENMLKVINSLTEDTTPDLNSDFLLTYDNSASGVKKVLASRITLAAPYNFAQNPGFDVWQRQSTATAVNTARSYVADRWYAKNSLGTNGILTTSRQTGNVAGSKYALKLLISTAPTALQTNGCELYQVLENFDSINFYNKTASFGIYVRAFGNVNQVGVQFFYATTETALASAIGSEVTATVSTGADTLIKIDGQALGTLMTTSGVIGVRIRITGVSSGNTYDINNGFQVEQAMLHLGNVLGGFAKPDHCRILHQCYRFYEKSHPMAVFPLDSSTSGRDNGAIYHQRSGSNSVSSAQYKATKRTTPTVKLYNPSTGTIDEMRNIAAATNIAATATSVGDTGFSCVTGLGTDGDYAYYHFVADAEI